MKKYFAGIGSRETPESIIPNLEYLSERLVNCGFTLRSGGAGGADTFWENSYDKFGGSKEIYLPWKGFNRNSSNLYELTPEAEYIASIHHPNWLKLSLKSRAMHTRNVFQVMGFDLVQYSDFIICWTPDGKPSGGTSQAIRIANHHKIPVFNLFEDTTMNQFDSFLTLNYIL